MGAVKTAQTNALSPGRQNKEENGHKRYHRIFRLDTMIIFFTRRVVKSRHRFHMEAMALLFLGVFMASGVKAMIYLTSIPALIEWLDQRPPEASSDHYTCNSIISLIPLIYFQQL